MTATTNQRSKMFASWRMLVAKMALILFVVSQVFFEFEFLAHMACGIQGDDTLANVMINSPTISPSNVATSFDADLWNANDISNNNNNNIMFKASETYLEEVRFANKHKEVNLRSGEGSLCYVGSLSTLDETTTVLTTLLYLGTQLDRTVVLPPYFTNLYDVYLLMELMQPQRNMSDIAADAELETKVKKTTNVSKNQALCDPYLNPLNVTEWNETWPMLEAWPAALHERDDEMLFIGGHDLSAHNKDLSVAMNSAAGRHVNPEQILFTNMFPHKETRADVYQFITNKFGADEFVSVHLDTCEDAARIKTQEHKCAETDIALLHWILKQHGASNLIDAPIFLSVSPEFESEHPGIVTLFRDAGAVSFNGPCPRLYECDMVIREIAAHSAFFYSAKNSATSKHIQNLRQWRSNVVSFTQHPAVIEPFSIREATSGGWKADTLKRAKETSPPTTQPPQTPAAAVILPNSHYQNYLSKFKSRSSKRSPISFPSNGVICQLGLFEQLNNVINQGAALLHFGHYMKRTVVMPPLLAQLYDLHFLERDQPFRVRRGPGGQGWVRPARVSTDLSLCDPHNGWHFAKAHEGEGATDFMIRYKKHIAPVLVMSAKDMFHYGFDDRRLFKYLHAHTETREIAVNFVEKTFGIKPFVAVHLRFLDGWCYKKSKSDPACDLDPPLLRHVLTRYAPQLVDAPIFVASDHQRPDLELLFAQAGAVFYRGKCHSYDKQCMVIDAEIAARSAYFYGLHMSTAAQNIERFRRQRANGSPFRQKKSFPTLTEAELPRHIKLNRWKGGKDSSPETHFASRPKESADQVALTLPPSLEVNPSTEPAPNLGCHEKFGMWISTVLWVFVGLLLALPSICTLLQFGCQARMKGDDGIWVSRCGMCVKSIFGCLGGGGTRRFKGAGRPKRERIPNYVALATRDTTRRFAERQVGLLS